MAQRFCRLNVAYTWRSDPMMRGHLKSYVIEYLTIQTSWLTSTDNMGLKNNEHHAISMPKISYVLLLLIISNITTLESPIKGTFKYALTRLLFQHQFISSSNLNLWIKLIVGGAFLENIVDLVFIRSTLRRTTIGNWDRLGTSFGWICISLQLG